MTPFEFCMSLVVLIIVCAVIWLSVDTWRLRGDLNHTRHLLDQARQQLVDLDGDYANLVRIVHDARSTTADLAVPTVDVPDVDVLDEVDDYDAETAPTVRPRLLVDDASTIDESGGMDPHHPLNRRLPDDFHTNR